MTSRSVHSRSASSAAIQARDGIAVSIATASLVSVSPMTWTLVTTGPTTRVRSSMGIGGALGLELCPDAVEGLADHLVGGPLDEPGTHRGNRPGDGHVGLPIHAGGAWSRTVAEAHLRG